MVAEPLTRDGEIG